MPPTRKARTAAASGTRMPPIRVENQADAPPGGRLLGRRRRLLLDPAALRLGHAAWLAAPAGHRDPELLLGHVGSYSPTIRPS